MERIYIFIFSLFFLLGVFSLVYNTVFDDSETFNDTIENETAVLRRVIDGDTVVLENDERVRLLGFDSQEKGEECFDPSTEKLKELIDGDEIKLVHSGERNRDTYGRLLRYIFQDGRNINREMVREGHGIVVRGDEGDKFISELIKAEKKAWKEEKGCRWNERNVSDVCEAEEYEGEWGVFKGFVNETHEFEEGYFLNFGGEFPENCFTAVLWDDELYSFLVDEKELKNEKTKIHGVPEMYDGTPQITLDRKSQVRTN